MGQGQTGGLFVSWNQYSMVFGLLLVVSVRFPTYCFSGKARFKERFG